MPISVVPFERDAHLDETVQLLLRVRDASPTYPPPSDVDRDVCAFTEWLTGESVIGRWVALEGDRVVGHVSLTEPHDYLLRFLAQTTRRHVRADELCEVAKLFVDPGCQRRGAGASLLSHALQAANQLNRVPALAVVADSHSARRLYEQSSLRELGTLEGVHGTNHVFMGELIGHEDVRS